jgi:flavorubredoxin
VSEHRIDQSSTRPVIPLTDDVLWVRESFELPDGRYEHVSVYLIRTPEGEIVLDSGSFYHRQSILERLGGAIGPKGVVALVLSHSDYPHSANIRALREQWGDFEIIASCGDPPTQGLPYATRSRLGAALQVAGRNLRFLDPPLADRSHTSWIYDEPSRVMFVADGFGCYHALEEADWTSRDYPSGIPEESIRAFHEDTIVWLRYVDATVLNDTLRTLFDENSVSWVAPIHGAPIAARDLDDYLEKLERSVQKIAGDYQPVMF